MLYINSKPLDSPREVETVDQFATRKEAISMLKEYRCCYQGCGITLWLSSRSTKYWREQR